VLLLEAFGRSAMRARSRLMGTRCSSGAVAVSDACSRTVVATLSASGSCFGGWASSQAMTSDLRMRPSLPVPLILRGSRSNSLMRRRTAGVSTGSSACFSGAGLLAAVIRCAGFSPEASFPAVFFVAGLPSSTMARMSSASTTSPSLARISVSTPSAGAGTSSTTLSVSRSSRFSSLCTGSPSFLCQVSTVASVTDSGRVGTRISMGIKASSG